MLLSRECIDLNAVLPHFQLGVIVFGRGITSSEHALLVEQGHSLGGLRCVHCIDPGFALLPLHLAASGGGRAEGKRCSIQAFAVEQF